MGTINLTSVTGVSAVTSARTTGTSVSTGGVELDPGWGLTSSEAAVALIVAEGATNEEIAARLNMSVRTVEAHLTKTFRKLSVRGRTGLVARLYRG
jgi:DNA-binding CsgD family transcriptional regulator